MTPQTEPSQKLQAEINELRKEIENLKTQASARVKERKPVEIKSSNFSVGTVHDLSDIQALKSQVERLAK